MLDVAVYTCKCHRIEMMPAASAFQRAAAERALSILLLFVDRRSSNCTSSVNLPNVAVHSLIFTSSDLHKLTSLEFANLISL